jgi:uncharacterized membrane protein YkvA (DUF1232 family)
MSLSWPLLVLIGFVLAYLIAVGSLLLLGRRSDARALAGFVPDCAILLSRLARDPCVPRRRAALIAALAIYLSVPFDLVPDFLPVLGQLDDAILVAVVLRLVIRDCGRARLEEHWPGPAASLAVVLRLAGASTRSGAT